MRSIARRLSAVLIQSGLLLASVQIGTVALWRAEMHPNVETRGSAYVLLPLGVLPKLYTLLFLIILLSTPPPGAAGGQSTEEDIKSATSSATGSLPRVITLGGGSVVPRVTFSEKSAPSAQIRTGGQRRPGQPILMVRPDWISLSTTTAGGLGSRPERSCTCTVDPTASGDSGTTLGEVHFHHHDQPASPPPSTSTTAQTKRAPRPSLAQLTTPTSSIKTRDLAHEVVHHADDDGDDGFADYRSYRMERKAAARTPIGQDGDLGQPPSSVSTLFPSVEHPYAASIVDMQPATPTMTRGGARQGEGTADAGLDVEELCRYKFGTLRVSAAFVLLVPSHQLGPVRS